MYGSNILVAFNYSLNNGNCSHITAYNAEADQDLKFEVDCVTPIILKVNNIINISLE